MMRRALVIMAGLVAAGLTSAGCQEDKPSNMRERQDRALADPFGYSPHPEPYDVSGGGIMDFKKDAFKRDLDSVLGP